jgi:hypothetical protein
MSLYIVLHFFVMLTTAFFIVVLSVAFFVILSVVFFIVMLSVAFFVIVSVIMPSIVAAIDKHKRSKIVISMRVLIDV